MRCLTKPTFGAPTVSQRRLFFSRTVRALKGAKGHRLRNAKGERYPRRRKKLLEAAASASHGIQIEIGNLRENVGFRLK